MSIALSSEPILKRYFSKLMHRLIALNLNGIPKQLGAD